MKSCTVIVKIEPPEVDLDDVEDFLATDDLFVEYFNAFLALPSFPEPLCFNKETGGFEVVSDAKKTLALQIKMAMRSQRRTPKIYRAVKNHAFRDIPLIPLVEPKGPEKIEIDTSFNVTTLNKEQGIYWIKEERLPAFLASDTYLEYRLAKIVSQARLSGVSGDIALLRIDYRPRAKKPKRKEEEPPPDPKEVLSKKLFVCMGNTAPTECDSWFTRAQQAHDTTLAYATLSPRPSPRPAPPTHSKQQTTVHGSIPSTHTLATHSPTPVAHRPPRAPSVTSQRPQSADCRMEKLRRPDSAARASPMKSSVFSSPFFGCYTPGVGPPNTGSDTPPLSARLFARESTPAPTPHHVDSTIAATVEEDHTEASSHVVYKYPRPSSSASSCDHHLDGAGMDVYSTPGPQGDQNTAVKDALEDASKVKGTSWSVDEELPRRGADDIVLRTVDDMGAVIVGAVLKRTVADVAHCSETLLQENPQIKNIFPHDGRYNHVTVDMLDNVVLDPCFSTTPPYVEPEPLPEDDRKYPPFDKDERKEESDADSLLDSDEDYEEADTFFRRHKKRRHYNLTSRRGIEHFKTFLQGTLGERYWCLWVDIDRTHMLKPEDTPRYLQAMREKYFCQGSMFELPAESKNKLGLTEPSKWTIERLQAIQNRVAEPLVLYWAPRFLIRQVDQMDPNRYKLYSHNVQLRRNEEAFPRPVTTPLLPLRPKSCRPRLQTTAPVIGEANFISKPEIQVPELPMTSPRVGYLRRHLPEVVPPTPRTQAIREAQAAARRPPAPPRKPRDFLCSRILGQHSRNARTSDSDEMDAGRPSSARSLASSLTDSGSSDYGSAQGMEDDFPSPSHRRPSPTRPHSSRPSSTPRLASAVRPASAPRAASPTSSTASSGIDSEHSEFCGGERMEALLQALDHERPAGGFFRTFIEKSRNKCWVRALQFWTDLQEYHKMFYSESVDPYIMDKKAQYLYSQFIVESAPCDIQCESSVRRRIFERLYPPYEDLFDSAEEHCLNVLYDAWVHCLSQDLNTYNKVELIEVKRHLETKSKYVLHLQRRGIIKETSVSVVSYDHEKFPPLHPGGRKFYRKLYPVRKDSLQYPKTLPPPPPMHLWGRSAPTTSTSLYAVVVPSTSSVKSVQAVGGKQKTGPSACSLKGSEAAETNPSSSRVVATINVPPVGETQKPLPQKVKMDVPPDDLKRAATPETPVEGGEEPVYDETLLDSVEPEFRDYSLEKLVHNRVELEHFRQFLADKYAGTDLLCWMDIEAWRRMPPSDEKRRDQKAKEIKLKYLNKKYFFGPNSPAGREGQNQVMAASGGWGRLLEDKPSSVVLLEAQKYVRQRLEKKWLPLFLATPDFVTRQRPRASMDDVVDDVMVQKRRRSQAVWKLLESRWVTSSKEIITFRKALLNPVTCLQFQRFVSIKGDNFENDVLFWIEVQKYKNLYHAHSDESTINQKIWAIINCFIDSSIPPSLQIDVPQEMADRIMDRKHERGPYLFREAQLTVFRVLFPHWNEFCHFRQNLAEEAVMPTIERQRMRTKAQQRKRLQEQEERMAKDQEQGERLMAKDQAEREAAALLMDDPFRDTDYIVEDEDEAEDEKEKISFTYSNYMDALSREDMLNNCNESMFSSLLGGSQAGEIPAQDTMSMVSLNTKPEDQNANALKRKNSRVDSAQADKSQTTGRKDSCTSSGGEKTAPKASTKRKGSAKEATRSPPTPEEQADPPGTKMRVDSPPSRKPPKSPGVGGGTQRTRLSRTMPPLVQKRPS